jgi:putative ABC transport system ATP-binding protein
MKSRGKALLDQLGLHGRYYSNPTQLSGGQCQRVAIARALANEPPVILADEPTGNLDEKTGLEVMQIFSDLNRAGKTIILVTHNPAYAAFSTHQINIHDGTVTFKT